MGKTSRDTFRLFKLSSIYGFGKLSTKAFSFITTPILTRFLTIADYGTLGLLSVISGFLGYIYPMSAHVLLASDYAKSSDAGEKKVLISTMFWYAILTSSFWTIVTIVCSGLLANLLNSPSLSILIIILALSRMFTSYKTVPGAYIQFHHKALLYTSLVLVSSVLNVVGIIVVLVVLKKGVMGILMVGLIVQFLTLFFYIKPLFPELGWIFSWKVAKEIFRVGAPMLPHSLAHWVLTSIDLIFLKKYATSTEVGLYSFGYKFGFIANFFVYGFSASWGPYFYKTLAAENDDPSSLRKPFLYSTTIIILIISGILFFAPAITHVLAPVKYLDAVQVIPWILLGYIFLMFYYGISGPLFYYKKTLLVPLITGLTAGINCLLNYLWIPRYGMLGAALATVLSYFILFILFLFVSSRYLKLNFDWFKLGITLAFLGGLVVILAKFNMLTSFSWHGFFIKLLIYLIACASVLYFSFGRSGVTIIIDKIKSTPIKEWIKFLK